MNYAQQAESIRRNAGGQIDTIRADKGLTPRGKAERMARVIDPANNQIAELSARYKGEKQERVQIAVKSLFNTPSDAAQTAAYRTAAFTVEEAVERDGGDMAKERARLERVLRRAALTGDAALSEAVGLIAYERGHLGILRLWGELTPANADDIEAVLSGNSVDKKQNFADSMTFSKVPDPPEMTTLPPGERAALS